MRAQKGDWVQLFKALLKPGERAPSIPEETAAVPLTMKVKGFLLGSEAAPGDWISARTVTGRLVQGELIEVNPHYPIDFGEPQAELMRAGLEARLLLERERGAS